jgi:hypothetical protein
MMNIKDQYFNLNVITSSWIMVYQKSKLVRFQLICFFVILSTSIITYYDYYISCEIILSHMCNTRNIFYRLIYVINDNLFQTLLFILLIYINIFKLIISY